WLEKTMAQNIVSLFALAKFGRGCCSPFGRRRFGADRNLSDCFARGLAGKSSVTGHILAIAIPQFSEGEMMVSGVANRAPKHGDSLSSSAPHHAVTANLYCRPCLAPKRAIRSS